jgi:hypothetical protein
MRRNAKLLGEDLPVARRLVEHVYEVGVFRFVLSRGFVQSLDFSAVGKAADTGKQRGEISS